MGYWSSLRLFQINLAEGQKYKQRTSPQSYFTQIKILAFPGLTLSGFEQSGPETLLLGWAKCTCMYH